MNHVTKRYLECGLPYTMSDEMKQAWADYLAGKGAPLRLLPTNGDRCTAATLSMAGCGHRLLIDGSCPNKSEHRDQVLADLIAEDEALS